MNIMGLRGLLISRMSRDQLISFIKRKDKFFNGSFKEYSNNELIEIALDIEKKEQEKRTEKK